MARPAHAMTRAAAAKASRTMKASNCPRSMTNATPIVVAYVRWKASVEESGIPLPDLVWPGTNPGM
jgi:hypothetical protein